MGWIVDHTGKARFLRRSYPGPTYRWHYGADSVEQEISFGPTERQRPNMTRRAFCGTSSLTQPIDPWGWRGSYRVEVNNPPLNSPDYNGWAGI
jgi:hypothetical protein